MSPAFTRLTQNKTLARLRVWLPPLILAALLLTVYLRTLAPGLTWAHYGADGGDLITAAFTGGVAHPGGYPLYLLAARLFQALPWGNLAWRTSLLSIVGCAGAGLLVYRLARRNTQNAAIAFTAGLAFGLAPLVWSQAVIAEVYGLHLLAMAAALTLLLAEKKDALAGLAVGLAAANHLSSLILLPLRKKPNLAYLGGVCGGLALYLLLPWRALHGAPVNWGNVTSLQRLTWLVSGALYTSQAGNVSGAVFLQRAGTALGTLTSQFGWFNFLLAAIGFFSGQTARAQKFSLAAVALVSFLFSALYNTSDSFIYLLPACISLALWLADGLKWLETLKTRLRNAALIVALLSLGWQTFQVWPQVDASQDLRAETFGREVMDSLPPNALVFARGDRAVFALWYFHFALNERPDVKIIASDLLGFDWYRENLRHTYPTLAVPPQAVFETSLRQANPGLTACQVTYQEWTELYCPPEK